MCTHDLHGLNFSHFYGVFFLKSRINIPLVCLFICSADQTSYHHMVCPANYYFFTFLVDSTQKAQEYLKFNLIIGVFISGNIHLTKKLDTAVSSIL